MRNYYREGIIEKVLSRNYYREGIRYVAKVYVVKIYVVKVNYILTFSKQPTYGSKAVNFANLLRKMLGEV